MLNRKSARLIKYDYKKIGYYFITICIKSGTLFGHIANSKMELNVAGEIVKQCWLDLPQHYRNCKLDNYVIMPDHFHGIVIIHNNANIVGAGLKPAPEIHSLTEIIRGFKTFSSRRINESKYFKEKFHWQRSFYDRVIRNENELFHSKKYINQNPIKWELEDK
jgi:putative transposase